MIKLIIEYNVTQTTSVVRLQSGIDLDDDESIDYRQGRVPNRLIRPRSLESDLLLLPLPNGKLNSSGGSISPPTPIPIPTIDNDDKNICNKNDHTVPNRFLKRTITTATCAVAPRMHEFEHRNLSDTSTSPER